MSPSRNTIVIVLVVLAAGCASGPYGVRPEIRNVGDGGEGREEITIQFEVFDEDLTRPSVAFEYYYGGSWHEATLSGATVAATEAPFAGNTVLVDCAAACSGHPRPHRTRAPPASTRWPGQARSP